MSLSGCSKFRKGQKIKRKQCFIISLLQGVMRGLAYLHIHDKWYQNVIARKMTFKMMETLLTQLSLEFDETIHRIDRGAIANLPMNETQKKNSR